MIKKTANSFNWSVALLLGWIVIIAASAANNTQPNYDAGYGKVDAATTIEQLEQSAYE